MEQIKELNEKQTNLKQQLEQLMEKNKSLEQTLAEYETVTAARSSENEAKLKDFLARETNLQDKMSQITAKLEAANNDLELLKEEKLIVSTEKDHLLAVKTSEFEEKIKCFSNEKVELEKQIEELKSECGNYKDHLTKLQADNDLLQNKIEKVVTEKNQVTEKLTQITNKLKTNDDDVKIREEQIQHLKQKETELNNVTAKLQIDLASLNDEKLKLSAENQSLMEKIASLDKEMAQIKLDTAEQINEADRRITLLTSEKLDLESKLTSVTKTLEIVSETMAQVKSENSSIIADRNALSSRIIELEKSLAEQLQKYAALEQDKEDVIQQSILLKNAKEQLKEDMDKIRALSKTDAERLTEELAVITKELESSEKEKNKLIADLATLNEQNKVLNEASSTKDQIQVFKSQITHLQKMHSDEKESLMQDTKILKAKLYKERELLDKKQKEHDSKITETRHEFEEKLERMKEKMVSLRFFLYLYLFCYLLFILSSVCTRGFLPHFS